VNGAAAPAPDALVDDVRAGRWAWVDVDLDAVAHNVRVLQAVAGTADVWAVVKANGYGHGAVPVARAALAAGARQVCVALVQEGVELRAAGIDAPVLVLSEQPPAQLDDLVRAGLTPTVYSAPAIDAVQAAVRRVGVHTPYGVHLKIDTGMRRVGAAVADAGGLVALVRAASGLRLAGVFTHLAVADEPDHAASTDQLAVFDAVLAGLDLGPDVVVHAANSAGLLAHPAARRQAVRAGIALYGIAPGPGVAELAAGLRPALSLRARVSFVKRVAPGDTISYGWRHRFERATTVATVPIGYADGVPRRLFACGAELLVGGRRRPIVGVVTMDQLMVDCGDDPVAVGDEVVLIGRQGGEQVTADEWAERLGTIGYEIVCGLSPRLPRRYSGPG
jgi:alanine racemase